MNAISPGNSPTSSNADSAENTHHDKRCKLCGLETICEGLGMIGYDVPIGDPRFGKLYRCPNFPIEKDVDHQERLRKISNLGAYAEKNFKNFYIDSPAHSIPERQSLEMAYNLAQAFARKPEGWLLFEGTYGCGKTHLAAAIGNARMEHGDAVLFITSPDLLDHLRSAYGPASEADYDETFERVRNTKLLILDDLGVENPSPWAQEKLFQLLNHRYAHHLPTIITTNAEVDRLDPRIRSRLLDNLHTKRVKITAPDYRSLAQNEREQLFSTLSLYTGKSFDNFDPYENSTIEEQRSLELVLRGAYDYAVQGSDHWLLFMGPFGTGKTHLAAAIAHYRQDRGEDVLFLSVSDLLDYLRATYSNEMDTSFFSLFQKIRKVRFLVLDGYGAENPSTWAKEKLFQILDYRYALALPTVITTAKEIGDLDPRIQSRILDTQLCSVYAFRARSYVLRRANKR